QGERGDERGGGANEGGGGAAEGGDGADEDGGGAAQGRGGAAEGRARVLSFEGPNIGARQPRAYRGGHQILRVGPEAGARACQNRSRWCARATLRGGGGRIRLVLNGRSALQRPDVTKLQKLAGAAGVFHGIVRRASLDVGSPEPGVAQERRRKDTADKRARTRAATSGRSAERAEGGGGAAEGGGGTTGGGAGG